MDSLPPSPKSSSGTRRRSLSPPARLALVLGLLLFAAMLALFLWPNPKVVWLPSSQLNRSAKSALFARFKFRLAILVWPMIHNYWHGRPNIKIDANVLTFSAAAANQTGLGPPDATNADGLRIWLVSQTELAAFRSRLIGLPGAKTISRSRIQTGDGGQANLQEGGPVIMGPQGSGTTNWSTQNHFSVTVTPKIASTSIRLTISVLATEEIVSQGSRPTVKTNLAAACRILAPNTGGLIIDGGRAKDGSGNSYWLIASPTAVDSNGNPVKL